MIRRRTITLGLVLAAACLVTAPAAPVAAQERGSQSREEMEQRFRRQMSRLIQERLGLDETEAAALGEVMRSFEARRRELGRSELAVRRRVEALMLEGGEDEAEAQELLARMVDLRRQESLLFEEEQAALQEVLSAVQVLQLQSLREEMGRRIRSMRGGGGGPPGRRRGPPPGDTVGFWPDGWER